MAASAPRNELKGKEHPMDVVVVTPDRSGGK